MNQADWKTIGEWAGKMWAALGPLVGIFIGSWLTNHHLKQSRIADSKKEEYRELLSTLTRTLKTIAQFHAPVGLHSGAEEREYDDANDEALISIDTRLFIRKEIDKIELRTRWQSAVQELEQNHHSVAFVRTVRKITDEIKETADHLFD